MIRRNLQDRLLGMASKFPFVLLTGPRQAGKSTLCKMAFPSYDYVSFSDLDIRSFAQEDPRGFIASYPRRTIIDEVQNVPSILSYLQTHCDSADEEGMYILTGSQNMQLMASVDETLAGRVGILSLLPFSHSELKDNALLPSSIDEEIFTGSYPRIFHKQIAPTDYYPSYIKTYVERDVRRIKAVGELSSFVRFIKLCAGRIGQLLNKSSLAVECGISEPTAASWLSILEQCYIIHFLRPDANNFSKRLVKSPKLYFYDTGLACSLLEISSAEQLSTHYLRGSLFENLVINELLKQRLNDGREARFSFWRDSNGNELDLLISEDSTQKAFGIKSGSTFNSEWLKGLKYWRKLSGADVSQLSLVYQGKQRLLSSYATIIPWAELA